MFVFIEFLTLKYISQTILIYVIFLFMLQFSMCSGFLMMVLMISLYFFVLQLFYVYEENKKYQGFFIKDVTFPKILFKNVVIKISL